MTAISTKALLEQMANVTVSSEKDRVAIQEAARQLSLRMEDGIDTINRICYAPQVQYVHDIAANLDLFRILTESSKPLSVAELAKTTGGEVRLISRVLRFVASHGSVEQTDATHFQANALTRTLAVESYKCGLFISTRVTSPAANAAPAFLASTNHRNPVDDANCPVQLALNIPVGTAIWDSEDLKDPKVIGSFGRWMSDQRRPYENWATAVDLSSVLKNTAAETPIFVDVGGSGGHQAIAFKQHFSSIPGRVILQDRPNTVKNAIPFDGIEAQGVDFWQGQDVKDARIYYMRMILHDFADDRALKLLKITKEAMGPESVIAIDEMIVPDVGAHPRCTSMDMNIMSVCAATERTQSEWRELLQQAGLKIKEVNTYSHDAANGIILAVPA